MRMDITRFGDAEQRWLEFCRCPHPSCPVCRVGLDGSGRCVDLDCPVFGEVVPVPWYRSEENAA